MRYAFLLMSVLLAGSVWADSDAPAPQAPVAVAAPQRVKVENSPVKIVHSEPRRMEATAFTRFATLLGHTGVEDPTRVALFGDPKERAGLYLETELNIAVNKLPAGTVAVVEILGEGDNTPLEFRFDVPSTVKGNAKALYLGLNRAPYNHVGKKELPRLLAWRVSLLDAQGQVLAEAPSALWQR